jgi:hypothetical protein
MNAMQIADLRIENFRGISTGHIRFGAHTVFVVHWPQQLWQALS